MKNLKEKIYSNLLKVPYGKVISYKKLGEISGTKGYRFVGSYMKNNEFPDKIPCYKVVCSDGNVGNYSGRGGVKKKIELLEKDGIKVVDGKVDLRKFGLDFLGYE